MLPMWELVLELCDGFKSNKRPDLVVSGILSSSLSYKTVEV
jgi:hypothetical protein